MTKKKIDLKENDKRLIEQNIPSQSTGSDDFCLAICPHCGCALITKKRLLGDTIICQDTGNEFIIKQHDI